MGTGQEGEEGNYGQRERESDTTQGQADSRADRQEGGGGKLQVGLRQRWLIPTVVPPNTRLNTTVLSFPIFIYLIQY